ncbi:serine-threonine protein kinase [Streptomyces sp. NPDC089919]|uniref:serine-threonine protein kinase n=1 Tax=Streptomyces sp. NPDC089919 TaxID=3155188 RepID=UPI00341BB071
MSDAGVEPYAELTFDADGDPGPGGRADLARLPVTDLLVFSHGWNNDRSTATRLYRAFFAPFPGLLADSPAVRLGYAGVLWPSMRFSDEPVPDFDPHSAAAGPAAGDAALDGATLAALDAFWPGRRPELGRIGELLAQQPESAEAFAEFGTLVRTLVAGTAAQAAATGAADLPAILMEDTLGVCRDLLGALAEAGAQDPAFAGFSVGDGLKKAWRGGKELLRQATYYEMKRRAGTVGERGLGPALAALAAQRPGLRIHLAGHSFGARLVSYALRGVPAHTRSVKSLTLLQGAFSHYAFADVLPHDRDRGGALRGLAGRVDGPVVSCFSSYDAALRVFYPLASRMAGDSASFAGFDERWGAMGHDGVQAVPGTPRLTLAQALAGGLPGSGCVSVDAAAVVRRGGAPSGAHSDICHAELARVILAAGRIGH